MRHRGDITEDDPTKVATELKSMDPDGQCIVLFIAAPPCQDFSRIGDRAGHQGERGYLFNSTAEFIAELRGLAAPRRFGVLVENVEMTQADAELGCVVVHHRLGGSRPGPLHQQKLDMVPAQAMGQVATGSIQGGGYRLGPRRFSEAVASGRARLPCSTTPAADEGGRPAPRTREKITSDTQQRWQPAGVSSPHGTMPRMRCCLTTRESCIMLLSRAVKEHHMPAGYTAYSTSGHARRRLIGNGWHWGVARRLLLALLISTAPAAS